MGLVFKDYLIYYLSSGFPPDLGFREMPTPTDGGSGKTWYLILNTFKKQKKLFQPNETRLLESQPSSIVLLLIWWGKYYQ